MAAARVGAAATNKPLYKLIAHKSNASTDSFVLPVPFINVLNSGEYNGNLMAFQEHIIAPTYAGSFAQVVQ